MKALPFAVTVAYATPDVESLVVVTLSAGATVNDAVAQSGIMTRLVLDPMRVEFAVFGQRVKCTTVINEGDRVELTRPLVADPKRSRRKRAADHPPPQSKLRKKPRS
jgi:putative ubiquitin-RnfH superfamily antitoxin RatB of RatAB toxin-antitoxin module